MSAINREDLPSETTDHTEENDDDDEFSDDMIPLLTKW